MLLEYMMSFFSTLHFTCVLSLLTFCAKNIHGDKLSRLQKKWFNEVDGLIDVFVGVCTENDNEPDGKAGIGVWFNSFHPSYAISNGTLVDVPLGQTDFFWQGREIISKKSSSIRNIGEPYEGLKPTHLKASIQGIISACRQARNAGIYNLRIHINNKQVIDICQNYLDDWKENNWFKKNGRVMKYKDQLLKLHEALGKMDRVEYLYVKHVGLYDESTLAYTLAKYGITKYVRKVLKPMWRATRSTTEQITTNTVKEVYREVKKIQRKPKVENNTELLH